MRTANFIVFGTGRSGSTLLVDMLNHHPQIGCDREIFNLHSLKRKPVQNLLRQHAPRLLIALHRAATMRSSRKPIYGFKLQSTQVPQPLRLLRQQQHDGWLVIWLYRRDLFRQIISTVAAHTTRRYNSNRHRAAEEAPPQVTIAAEQMTRLVNKHVRQYNEHRRMMAELPHLQVVYEDDLKQPADQLRTLQRIAGVLGADAAVNSAVTSVRPPWQMPYRQIVTL